jgi:hypothetical protein
MQSDAWPGNSQTGTRALRPSARIATTSPFARSSRSAVAGAISAALSQLSFVNGRGSSCSHPLLAKLPSQTCGSGRKITAKPPVDFGGSGWNGCGVGMTGDAAVPETTPRRSASVQA